MSHIKMVERPEPPKGWVHPHYVREFEPIVNVIWDWSPGSELWWAFNSSICGVLTGCRGPNDPEYAWARMQSSYNNLWRLYDHRNPLARYDDPDRSV